MGFIRNMTMDTSNQEAERFYKMGIDYVNGTNGMPCNEEMASYCLNKAAALGFESVDPIIQSKEAYDLGRKYELGIGVNVDLKRALSLYKQNSSNLKKSNKKVKPEVSQAERFYNMGLDYFKGKNKKPQYAKMALYCFEQAAKLGLSTDELKSNCESFIKELIYTEWQTQECVLVQNRLLYLF